jgi:hypothetical protein
VTMEEVTMEEEWVVKEVEVVEPEAAMEEW